MGSLRRPGGRWRLLVHEWRGRKGYGTAHNVSPQGGRDSEHEKHHALSGTEFDELVVGSWLHIEQMNAATWWMNVGGVTIHVTADVDGRPKTVVVHGPGDYAEAVPGVEYELNWNEARNR